VTFDDTAGDSEALARGLDLAMIVRVRQAGGSGNDEAGSSGNALSHLALVLLARDRSR
jgi:hypothetical protein